MPPSVAAQRFGFIDWYRGLACVLMFQTHAYDAWTAEPEAAARAHLASPGRPALILFGTAHGLHASVIERAELVIEPIQGVGAYNHLSVRAAAAITFDRLFSR